MTAPLMRSAACAGGGRARRGAGGSDPWQAPAVPLDELVEQFVAHDGQLVDMPVPVDERRATSQHRLEGVQLRADLGAYPRAVEPTQHRQRDDPREGSPHAR